MIAALSKSMGTVIRGVVDSGAADHVTNKSVAPQVPVKKTWAVGIKYTVADERHMYNEGIDEIRICRMTIASKFRTYCTTIYRWWWAFKSAG